MKYRQVALFLSIFFFQISNLNEIGCGLGWYAAFHAGPLTQ